MLRLSPAPPCPMTILYDTIESPVGPLVVGATAKGVCLLEFTGPHRFERQLATLARSFGTEIVRGTTPLLAALESQLDEYFAAQRKQFDLPLDYHGTPFQMKVWHTLLEIPYGETWSYRQVAAKVSPDEDASRAVGTANGANRVAIIIPCHRVVNANGALGGYGGGLDRKQFLLDLERGQLRLDA